MFQNYDSKFFYRKNMFKLAAKMFFEKKTIFPTFLFLKGNFRLKLKYLNLFRPNPG